MAQKLRFLADENFRLHIVEGLRRRHPLLDIVTVKEVGLNGKPDPEVLAYAAEQGRILVSHDVSTMPTHLRTFLASGKSSPGVFLIPQRSATQPAIEALFIAWGASDPDEWVDHYEYFP